MCSKDHEQKSVDDYCVDGEGDTSKRMVSGDDVLAYIVDRSEDDEHKPLLQQCCLART